MRVLALILALAAPAGCSSKPQEERVLEWVAEAVSLAEQGDAAGLVDLTASDFRVSPRSMDRRQLKLRLVVALQRFRKGTIHYPRPSVTLSGDDDQAEVSFAFLTIRGDPPAEARGTADEDSWLEGLANKGGLMRIHLRLRRDGDEWLATQARLERFVGTGFKPIR